MADDEKNTSETQAVEYVEKSEQEDDKLKSAQAHLEAAVADIRAFCEDELPKVTREIKQNIEEKVSKGMLSAADSVISVMEQLKEKLRERD